MVGSGRPYSRVSPRLVLSKSPMPPDCCREEKIPMSPPMGLGGCCWVDWEEEEDCWGCWACWGFRNMLAMLARLLRSIWGNCCCCGGTWDGC